MAKIMQYIREENCSSNKVYLMKKLYELRMKEGGSVSAHLNEFNILFAQLTSQGLVHLMVKFSLSSCYVPCLPHGIRFVQP